MTEKTSEQAAEEKEVQAVPAAKKVEKTDVKNSVFLICGKDAEMNTAAKEILAKLGFEAVLLGCQQEGTASILDESAPLEASFAIAVLSDDDVATPREEFPRNALLQPRSEETFVLGFLTAKLGAKNIALLHLSKQNFKKPFQHDSLTYIPFDKENRWHFDLVRELKSAGFEVDANKLI